MKVLVVLSVLVIGMASAAPYYGPYGVAPSPYGVAPGPWGVAPGYGYGVAPGYGAYGQQQQQQQQQLGANVLGGLAGINYQQQQQAQAAGQQPGYGPYWG